MEAFFRLRRLQDNRWINTGIAISWGGTSLVIGLATIPMLGDSNLARITIAAIAALALGSILFGLAAAVGHFMQNTAKS